MIYTFQCRDPECAAYVEVHATIKDGPPARARCAMCGKGSDRVWEPPQLLLRGDPDDVGVDNLMVDTGGMASRSAAAGGGITRDQAARKESRYGRYIDHRRKLLREAGQRGGRMTHQVPAELYHGKIRQTGDKDYWRDPANLNRHKSCKVS